MNYIISQCPGKQFVHFPHYIDTSIFSNNKSIKKYDILIYGNLSDWYPFRKRLLSLIKNNNYNYYYLQHPGYNENNEKNENTFITKEKLSLLINQSKLTICTSSVFDYFVKKYIEISLSGSIICGDFPDLENNIYLDNMCNINNNMSDEDILKTINKYLNLTPIEYNNIINNAYNISLSNFSHTIGVNKFNTFINNILLNQNNQKSKIENITNNDKKYYDASYDNYNYKTNCTSFQYYINNGLSQPYLRELKIIKDYLANNAGAHIGTVSIPLSNIYNQVLAFEPVKENYDLLEINIKLNNIENISTANLGLSNKNTTAVLTQHDNNSGSYYMKEIENTNNEGFNIIKLDEFTFNISVDFIKIDTEGSELYVLEGAYNTIVKYKPMIQIETNHCSNKFFDYDKQEIFNFMNKLNYKILD